MADWAERTEAVDEGEKQRTEAVAEGEKQQSEPCLNLAFWCSTLCNFFTKPTKNNIRNIGNRTHDEDSKTGNSVMQPQKKPPKPNIESCPIFQVVPSLMEDELFHQALVVFPTGTPDRWHRVLVYMNRNLQDRERFKDGPHLDLNRKRFEETLPIFDGVTSTPLVFRQTPKRKEASKSTFFGATSTPFGVPPKPLAFAPFAEPPKSKSTPLGEATLFGVPPKPLAFAPFAEPPKPKPTPFGEATLFGVPPKPLAFAPFGEGTLFEVPPKPTPFGEASKPKSTPFGAPPKPILFGATPTPTHTIFEAAPPPTPTLFGVAPTPTLFGAKSQPHNHPHKGYQ